MNLRTICYLSGLHCLLLVTVLFVACQGPRPSTSGGGWIPLIAKEGLEGWTARGDATWENRRGVLVGTHARGHLYADPPLSDAEIKGSFRITDQGGGSNGGLYFRAHAPSDNPDGFPRGYEAQICHHQEAFTGWLWKPGTPTGKATAMITKDGEWFEMRIRANGPAIQIWVNEQLVMTHEDHDYQQGQIALQVHNGGMTLEVKNLMYREL